MLVSVRYGIVSILSFIWFPVSKIGTFPLFSVSGNPPTPCNKIAIFHLLETLSPQIWYHSTEIFVLSTSNIILATYIIRGVPDRGFQNPAGTGLSGQNYENPAGLSGRIFSHDVSSREPPKDRVVPLRSRPQDQTIGSNHKLRLVLVMLISSNSQIQGIFHSSF